MEIASLNLFSDADLGGNPKSMDFEDNQFKTGSSPHYHFSVPPEALYHLSTLISNCEDHRGGDRNSMGRSSLQSDSLYVGKPCKSFYNHLLKIFKQTLLIMYAHFI